MIIIPIYPCPGGILDRLSFSIGFLISPRDQWIACYFKGQEIQKEKTKEYNIEEKDNSAY